MQNQHVTAFPNNADQYPGIPPENTNNAPYVIDPVLDGWNGQDPNQYSHSNYPIPPQQQYYNMPSVNYGQQQPHQQQQTFQGFGSIGRQPESYPYQAHTNQYAEQFYGGHPSQNNFGNGFEYEQPSQHETISPQALEVGDNIASVSQNAFHHGSLAQHQVFERNPQQDQWATERAPANSSRRIQHLVPPQRQRAPEYSAYPNLAASVRGSSLNAEYDSGVGQSSNGPPPTNSNVPIPRPNPLRVTNQELLDQYPENDAAHRVANLPFVVLGETVTKLDIRGKTTIPKYHAKGNSIGKKFGSRSDLFATRSAPAIVRKVGRPKKIDSKPKTVKSKASISKVIKRPVGRPPGSQTSLKQGSPDTPSLESSSESSEESEEEESEEEEEMNETLSYSDVRDPVRPTNDPASAAKYDVVEIVFREGVQHAFIDGNDVFKTVKAYEAFILGLRDNHKASVTALTDATARNLQSQIRQLTQEKETHYRALNNAVTGTLDYGHNTIVQNLGNNNKIVAGLWSVVRDFVVAGDYTNELLLNVLKLLTRFTGVKPEVWQQLKFDKFQRRFEKEGVAADKGKELLMVISRNAARITERNEGKLPAPGLLQGAITGTLERVEPTPPQATGKKRQFDGDDTGNPAKKTASGARIIAIPRPSTSAAKPPPQPNLFASLNRSTKALPNTNGVNNPAARTETPKPTPKPIFKPAPKPVTKPSVPTTSKLGELLASIEQPKPQPKAPVIPDGPPETPEEKKKRERKESRRHLRVKWRQGDELTQVKIFTRVEGEDEGRKDESVRDAHDERSEGMMHKQRAQEEVDIDEDEASGEIEFRPYPELYAVDFSDLDVDQEKRSQIYVTRGGQKTFFTAEQEIQNRREAMELMVVYTDPSDIPHSAKEPPVSNDAPREEKLVAQPDAPWLLQRMQEVALYGVRGALEISSARIAGQHPSHVSTSNFNAPQQYPQFTNNHIQPSHMNNLPMSSQTPTNPSTTLNPANMNEAQKQALVDSILAKIAPIMHKPFPANEPPFHMTDEREKAAWWAGYNRDKSLREASGAAPVQQPQPPQPAVQQPPMQNYQQQAIPSGQVQPQFDLQALLRQINLNRTPGQMQPQQTATQVPAPAGNFDWVAYMQNQGANQAPQQQAQQAWPAQNVNGFNFGATFNGGDDRYNNGNAQPGNQGPQQNWIGMPGHENNWGAPAADNNKMQWENSQGQQGGQRNQRGGGNWNRGDREEGGQTSGRKHKAYKQGTKPCHFFLQGKCAKGDKCTYSHSPESFPDRSGEQ